MFPLQQSGSMVLHLSEFFRQRNAVVHDKAELSIKRLRFQIVALDLQFQTLNSQVMTNRFEELHGLVPRPVRRHAGDM
jgi:hypothetical protein